MVVAQAKLKARTPIQARATSKKTSYVYPNNTIPEVKTMSHFTTIRTKLTNRDCLVRGLQQALAAKGIFLEIKQGSEDKGKKDDEARIIKVVERAERLINEFVEDDKRYAEVIISRKALGTTNPGEVNRQSLVDVGYLWNQKKMQFELQIDDYDYQRNILGAKFGVIENFTKAVQFEHDKTMVEKTLAESYPESLWKYGETTVDADGKITIEITKKPALVGSWH